MKRKRKQLVILDGRRVLVDVPEDDILYRLDSRAEYLRSRNLRFETSLDSISDFVGSPQESQPEYILEKKDLHHRLPSPYQICLLRSAVYCIGGLRWN